LRETLRVAGSAAVTCPTGPPFIRRFGGCALLRALFLDVLDHASIAPTSKYLSQVRFPVAYRGPILQVLRVADHYEAILRGCSDVSLQVGRSIRLRAAACVVSVLAAPIFAPVAVLLFAYPGGSVDSASTHPAGLRSQLILEADSA